MGLCYNNRVKKWVHDLENGKGGFLMILTHIMLTNMEAVNEFVRLTNAAEYKDLRIHLLCENSEVDAKSIMNVFSTDLSRPILLSADGDFTAETAFASAVRPFEVSLAETP